jgi:hypothetical protein
MSKLVNIAGLDKGAVLKALHDGTKPLGRGYEVAIDHLPLEQAQEEFAEVKRRYDTLKRRVYFDYYHGRSLKVYLDQDEFDPQWYNKDAGEGTAARVIAALREQTGET